VDRVGIVEACNNLGICYENLGQYAEANARYMQGRVILEELGDRAGVGAACTKIGNVYQKLGQYDTAITLHEHAKVIAEEVGNKTSMGKACNILAGCYQAQGQYDTAIMLLEQGRAIDEEVGDRGGAGQACGDLGVCCRRRLLDFLCYVVHFLLVLVKGFRNHVPQCLQMLVVDISVWRQPRQRLIHSPLGVYTREMFRLDLERPPCQ